MTAAEKKARKAKFIEQISLFAQRKKEDALTRKELVALDSLGRLQAQRQSILDNLSHYYATNPRADVAPGLIALNTFYSDNKRGACSLSVDRMARFLSRSERAVTDAIGRMETGGVIIIERRHRDTHLITPYIRREFGDARDPIMWIMEARAPKLEQGKPGRPRKEPNQENQGEDNFTPVSENQGEDERKITLKTTSPNNYVEEDNYVDDDITSAHACEMSVSPYLSQLGITEEDADRFNGIHNEWQRRANRRASPEPRSNTDKFLTTACRAHPEVDPAILQAAVLNALNLTDMAIATADKHKGSTAASYFTAVLATQVGKVALARASAEAAARTEQVVAEKRAATRVAAIGQRRGPVKSSDVILDALGIDLQEI